MTLPLYIPSSAFNLQFFFVPFLPNEKIFSYELKGLSTKEDMVEGISSFSLFWLKKKICQVAKYFYTQHTHVDPKSNRLVKFGLTTHEGQMHHYSELSPHELIIAAVKKKAYNRRPKFHKIFGDHMHNLLDIQNSISPDEMIVVYQIDPRAIDREKLMALQGEEHKMKFPEALRENMMLVPCELMVLTKNDQNSQDIKDITLEYQPPRFFCIDLTTDFIAVHKRILRTLCNVFENKTVQ